jgi:hypothetical protein
VERINGAVGSLIGVIAPRAIAASVGPAQRNGKAAALTGGLAHDVSNLLGVGRRLGSPALEHLDDDHAGAATRAWAMQHPQCVRCDIWLLLRVGGRRVGAEQCAGCCDVLGAVGVGEEPIVMMWTASPERHQVQGVTGAGRG